MCTILIDFESPLPVFQPSCQIRGTTKFILEEPLKAKLIKVILEGKATTKWDVAEKSSDSHSRSSKVPYSASIEYATDQITVWAPDGDKKMLAAGEHVFEFEFKLPCELPPSFEGNHGSVRYSITAVAERPWKTNKSFVRYFTVVPVFNLALVEPAFIPIDISRSKTIGVLFFRHGKINLNCKSLRSGYVSGETVTIDVSIENNTSKPITRLDVSLIEKAEYVAYRYGAETTRWHGNLYDEQTLGYNNKHVDDRKITKEETELLIPPHKSESRVVHLSIPAMGPSFTSSAIVHVKHVIEVKVHTKGTINNTARCICPVIIGTISIGTQKNTNALPTFEESVYICDTPRSPRAPAIYTPTFPYFGHLTSMEEMDL